jgi:hypothetical protein
MVQKRFRKGSGRVQEGFRKGSGKVQERFRKGSKGSGVVRKV